jgi:hypothetical protein
MKVVFKVGGGANVPAPGGGSWTVATVASTTGAHSWFHLPPVFSTPPPQPVMPAYNHIERRSGDGNAENEEDSSFVSLSDNTVVIVTGDAGDARKRGGSGGNMVAASSSRQSSSSSEWPRRGDVAGSESLVKRLRDRMAMEAALRNEAVSEGQHPGFRLLVLALLLLVAFK